MNWFERSLLSVYSFIVGIISIVSFLVFLGWNGPVALLETTLGSDQLQAAALITTVLMFAASVKLLLTSLQKKVDAHTIIKNSNLGQVNISLEAIENLVRKTGLQIAGIKDLKPRIVVEAQGISVIIKAVVASEVNIPALLDQLQQQVKDYLAEVAGLEVRNVKVLVTSISGSGKLRVE
ncbi:MAG TPA: alkaline shock response membrane anchor protein AmaP [Bacillota bacterium]|nr:alkaline shock response membrane anchor protein AmaP [Bacillota bacterium]